MQRDIREMQFRSITLDRKAINAEARTVDVAISSEHPVERWFGMEILDHGAGSADLSRLQDGGPVLLHHDTRDVVGVVEAVHMDGDRVLRGTVRFGRSARAEEAWQDVQDGIRNKISVGYQIDAYETTKGQKGAPDTIRATRWTPLEVSFVAVPADPTVGVGREFTPPAAPAAPMEVRMDTNPVAAQAAAPPNVEELRSAATLAAVRVLGLAEKLQLGAEAQDMLRQGLTPEATQGKLLELASERQAKLMAAPPPASPMTPKEQASYSIARAILQAAGHMPRGFEWEVSQDLAKKLGRESQGILIPTNVRAALDTIVAGAAKELVDTAPLTFIEMLRNRTKVLQLGATFMPGLTSNIPFVRQITGGGATWTGDNPGSGVAESNPTIETFTMSPKQLMANRSYSKALLVQTGGVADRFVNDDLSKAHALAVDLAAIHGTGASNQPKGIVAFAGIGSVAGGINGLAPTWDHIVGLETEVAIDNADNNTLAYFTNAKVRGKLKRVQKVPTYGDGFIWEGGPTPLNGYRAEVSNQVSSSLTKGTSNGVCSAIIFGDWSQLLVGEWSALDVVCDPFTNADKGLIRVISTQLVDTNLRHVESFAAMLDALTV